MRLAVPVEVAKTTAKDDDAFFDQLSMVVLPHENLRKFGRENLGEDKPQIQPIAQEEGPVSESTSRGIGE